MRIPHSISINTLKAYEPPKAIRERFARDRGLSLDFDERPPKPLTVICVEVVAQNWAACGYPIDLPLCDDSCLLLELLPLDLPLAVAVARINEDIYWKRAYAARWPNRPPRAKRYTDVTEYRRNSDVYYTTPTRDEADESCDGERSRSSNETPPPPPVYKFATKTWKENYLERHLTELLERLPPEDYDPEMIKELSILCRDHVTSLELSELRAARDAGGDHVPLNAILASLTRLREFSLCFKQTYVGEDFSWHVFKTTHADVQLLSDGIAKCPLTTLRVRNSDIDCAKSLTLMRGLARNDTLRVLDLSHCNVSDSGVLAVCKLIVERNALETLVLTNNDIGPSGAEVLGYVIRRPECRLRTLNLRLNEIGDRGGQYLITALVRDAVNLKCLILAGCGLTKRTTNLGRMLAFNATLETIDLSGNRLEEAIGEDILKGMQYNRTIIACDTRMCAIDERTERAIRRIIHENRTYIRLSFQERGIVRLRKVVAFIKEFDEDANKKLDVSARDFASEIESVFDCK